MAGRNQRSEQFVEAIYSFANYQAWGQECQAPRFRAYLSLRMVWN
jgi:hypothetical protein